MKIFLTTRYKAATWFVPAAILGMFAHLIVLPMAKKTVEIRMKTEKLASHKYEKAWLDSVNSALDLKVKKLSAHIQKLRLRTISPAEIQGAADQIRNILSRSGVEVIRSSPELIEDPDLNLLIISFQGTTDFDPLMKFFVTLKDDFPQYSIERMTIRKAKEELSYSMTFRVYSINNNNI